MSFTESGFEHTRDIDAIINARAAAQDNEDGLKRYRGPRPVEYDEELTVEDQNQIAAWRSAIAIDRAVGKLPQTFVFDGVLPTKTEGMEELYARVNKNAETQETKQSGVIYEA